MSRTWPLLVIAALGCKDKPANYDDLKLPLAEDASLQLELAPPPPPPPPEPPKPVESPTEFETRDGDPPSNIPPTAFEQLRIAGEKNIVPDDDTKKAIADAGRDKLVASFKLCISATGAIDSVETLKSSGFPAYDDKITTTIRDTWKYRPHQTAGKSHPVCTAVTFIYQHR
jgi:outer membrane biosynthesis protein TonB